ncbi:4a-hydroxytetrahydrobiopterin dehydratase [uncultured Jatrophihabitans sp.]|uniref:4a-hydroxytetrahydrobiopterin dehydratase n=1 Tax=uncultured Jatrophihabitans sp. TaxID=1610747 RepID=UPI0035C972C9
MTDQQQTLTAVQVREAGIDEWRQILGRIKARFHTGDFATGLALVNKIGAAAEVANHHPDVTLTYTDVIVTLSSHDVHGITSRDVELAQQISGHAAELGVEADVAGLTQLELGLDTAVGEHLAPFYAALFGAEVVRGEPVDASGQVPTVWWQNPQETDEDVALPEQQFEQRWHFDVWVPHDDAERRLQAVLDAGGRLVSDATAPSYWVVEDADGNRSCICTPAGR